MPEEASSRRVDIATWVGTVLWIIMIESHVMSRPLVFLFWPFVALFCFLPIASAYSGEEMAAHVPSSCSRLCRGFFIYKIRISLRRADCLVGLFTLIENSC
jgi:hypothetical protein